MQTDYGGTCMKKLTFQKLLWGILWFVAEFGVMWGCLMVVGGIGTIDLATETGEVLSKGEEIKAYMTSLLGFPVVFIFGKLNVFAGDHLGKPFRYDRDDWSDFDE